jgi:adenylate kinase family enzyme
MTSPSPRAFDILPGSRPEEGSALIVNIFGGPGSGKSTLAADIFCRLKQAHIETACPEEHAKLALWSGQPWLLDQQAILLGRTWETIHARLTKVAVIVVDSPILLCSVYARDREPPAFHQLVADIHKRSNRLNILLDRDPEHGYSQHGRRETAKQARVVDERIITTLKGSRETYIEAGGCPDLVARLVKTAQAHLGAVE